MTQAWGNLTRATNRASSARVRAKKFPLSPGASKHSRRWSIENPDPPEASALSDFRTAAKASLRVNFLQSIDGRCAKIGTVGIESCWWRANKIFRVASVSSRAPDPCNALAALLKLPAQAIATHRRLLDLIMLADVLE